jgi:phospholipid transport system substrate-binding protein
MSIPRSTRSVCALALLAATGLVALSTSAPAQTAPPATAPAATPRTAREFVSNTVDAVTKVLKDRTRSSHDRRMAIQELVDRWLDAETISKLALAKNWKSFDEAQQKDFVVQFRRHLVLTYYRNVDRYSFDRIDVYDERAETKGDFTVRTKVIAPSADDVLIDVRVRPATDGVEWKVIDILIEGVSLVQNFRSQFQEVLSNGKPDQLLQSLREKNEATERKYVEAEAKEAPPSGGGGATDGGG